MNRPRRDTRAVDGILLLDKPGGITSNAALQRVKRHYRAAKAGHTGSLDPIATGLLPICFGQATKLSGFLLDADKRYRATARLGMRTDTGDSEGQAVAQSQPRTDTAAALLAARAQFLGPQQQLPPMYSALKRDGMPLYALARQGLEVSRQPRTVEVFDLQLLSVDADTFTFEVHCSKGTYVRTLAEDWAAAAGQCAHLVVLRRLTLAGFSAAAMVPLERVEQALDVTAQDALLLPLAEAFFGWPRATADAAQALHLARGQAVRIVGAPRSGRLLVVDVDGQALAVAEIDADGQVAPRRWLGATAAR